MPPDDQRESAGDAQRRAAAQQRERLQREQEAREQRKTGEKARLERMQKAMEEEEREAAKRQEENDARRLAAREKTIVEKQESERQATEDALRKVKEEREAKIQKEREDALDALHAAAVQRRRATRHATAKRTEEHAESRAARSHEIAESNIAGGLRSRLAFLDAEGRRQVAKAAASRDLLLRRAQEEARKEKSALRNDPDRLRRIRDVDRALRKASDDAQEHYDTAVREIQQSMDALRDEARRQAEHKSQRADADRKRLVDNAAQKRRAEDEWLGIKDDEKSGPGKG